MKTLWSSTDRQDLLERLVRLKPDAPRKWGTMNASQMLAHVNDSFRMCYGELPTKQKKSPFHYPGLRQFIIYVAPWPRGAPTARELTTRPPADWNLELEEIRRLIEEFPKQSPGKHSPPHPAFGRLSRRAWGVLGYKHTDHHLRQFGL